MPRLAGGGGPPRRPDAGRRAGRGPRARLTRPGGACRVERSACADGVRRGLRRREAEARCPGLTVLEADLAAEARAFETVARVTEPITPGVVFERPGVLSFPTRGPSRYFGGDERLGRTVLDALAEIGLPDVRVGLADGPFAARLAARQAAPGSAHVVAPGDTPAFLASWPVEVLDAGGDLPALLRRLGLAQLGDFAALPAASVLTRFGLPGARLHRLAGGLDEHAAPRAATPRAD